MDDGTIQIIEVGADFQVDNNMVVANGNRKPHGLQTYYNHTIKIKGDIKWEINMFLNLILTYKF